MESKFPDETLHMRGVNLNMCILRIITKTCLYNFDPLKPHFYIVKLGFTWVYIIFLILLKNINCGYSLEPPHRGGSNEYPQYTEAVLTSTHNLCFEQEYEKYQNFLSESFPFLVVKFSIYLNRRVFVMCSKTHVWLTRSIYRWLVSLDVNVTQLKEWKSKIPFY